MAPHRLDHRGVVSITGEESATFLHGLVTANVETLQRGASAFGALLTPQGKILFDFLIHRTENAYFADLPREAVGAFVKRLGFYKLRSKIEIADVSDSCAVIVDESDDARPSDPRLASLGSRWIEALETAPADADASGYDAARIASGIAECWMDFPTGEVFPHEANFDLLHGVNLSKGCYVGQEVVSRMHHRGTARKRFLPCRIEGTPPDVGTDVVANDRVVGATGSASHGNCLALLRLDRISENLAGETPLVAGNARLWPEIPGWADFGLDAPGTAE